MKPEGSVLIPFEKSRIAVHWEGPLAYDIICFLFKTKTKFQPCSTDASFAVKEQDGNEILCYQGDRLLFRGRAEKGALVLMDTIIHELAKTCDSGLLFHAAALSRNGCGILMPGQSGSGKSSLSAWLAHQGHVCLTDEMALVRPETFEIHGFCKPIHIKDPTISGLAEILKKPDRTGIFTDSGVMPVDRGFLVDSSHLNPMTEAGSAAAGMIIFPEFNHMKNHEMLRLSPANTGLFLMKSLINARNIPSHGFDQIALLSRRVPAYLLSYGNFSRISRDLDALIHARTSLLLCAQG
ncbi:MAG: hypothetical protein V1793_03520 [Pseudomonadota bacterium]